MDLCLLTRCDIIACLQRCSCHVFPETTNQPSCMSAGLQYRYNTSHQAIQAQVSGQMGMKCQLSLPLSRTLSVSALHYALASGEGTAGAPVLHKSTLAYICRQHHFCSIPMDMTAATALPPFSAAPVLAIFRSEGSRQSSGGEPFGVAISVKGRSQACLVCVAVHICI